MAGIRALPPAEGFDQVRFPGELEWERAEDFRTNGIPLHREHAAVLQASADESDAELAQQADTLQGEIANFRVA